MIQDRKERAAEAAEQLRNAVVATTSAARDCERSSQAVWAVRDLANALNEVERLIRVLEGFVK